MEFALVMFAWLLGTVSGALWMTSAERGERAENARLQRRLMVFFYSLGLLTVVITDLASWVAWFMGSG